MQPEPVARASLSPGQKRLLEAVAESELGGSFHLSGAGALAGFYTHHRRSRDLDFFSQESVPLQPLQGFLESVPGLRIDSFHKRYDRRIFLVTIDGEQIEIEFTRYPFPPVREPLLVAPGVRVESVLDIALNKLFAMCDRRDGKDDVDLFVLLTQGELVPMGELLAAAEEKFRLPGMRWILQRRLLAVPEALPPTTTSVSRAEIQARFRAEAELLIPPAALDA